MSERIRTQHVDAEEFQAWLDGALSDRERARVEAHLAHCALCEAELESWQALYRTLAAIPVLVPSPAFSERVLAGVKLPEPLSLAARARARLGLSASGGHLTGERLQDFVEGALGVRQAARVRAHLDSCPECSAEAAAWRGIFARLESLPELSPTEGFADRVMARVRVPEVSLEGVGVWRPAPVPSRPAVLRPRRAWAAVSGLAVAPVLAAGLVLWTLFSHPTFTVGALASFLAWKASALAAGAWEWLASHALQSTGLFELYSLVGSLTWSPATAGGAFVALSAGTVGATWVLYRNLYGPPSAEGRVTHAPLS